MASLSGPGYRVRHLGPGIAGSLFAGVVSALFGVGGGSVKVPVMNLVMAVPLRVATATSNLMIGVTASAGAVVYLYRGGIDPFVTAPAALGVFAGASLAARLADRVDSRVLRSLFVVMLLFTAVPMKRYVGAVLTLGTYFGVALLGVGVVGMAAAGTLPIDKPFPPFEPGRLLPDLMAFRSAGFLWVGLAVVIATPAARVLASLLAFAWDRDGRMVAVAGAILAVIGLSAYIGAGV